MFLSVWGTIGLWMVVSFPTYKCQCPPFNQSKLNEFSTVENINTTTVRVKCKEGLPFHTDGSNYTHPSVSPIIAHCLPSGKWAVDSIGCWEGLLVNVDGNQKKSFVLPTERPAIFLCVNLHLQQYEEVILHLGHQQVKNRIVAWTNRTFTWHQDGILVRCEYVSHNTTTKGNWKPIRLQYESGFGKVAKKYTFKMGRPMVMEIPIHSKNGDVRREDVKIFHGIKEFTSFLIIHHKARHLQFIILKIQNFLPEDQGNYTIVLHQPGHDQKTDLFTLQGDPEYYSTIATTVGVAIGCVLLVVVLVIAAGCGIKKYRRTKHIIGGDNNDDVFLPSRTGIRQMLIVDDDEQSTARSSVSGDERNGDRAAGGWRRPIELVETGSGVGEVNVMVERHDEPCSSRSA